MTYEIKSLRFSAKGMAVQLRAIRFASVRESTLISKLFHNGSKINIYAFVRASYVLLTMHVLFFYSAS